MTVFIAPIAFVLSLVLPLAVGRMIQPGARFAPRAVGGLIAFGAAAGALALLGPRQGELYALLACSGGAFLLGLADDRRRLRSLPKLIVLAVLAWVAAYYGIRITELKVPFFPRLAALGGLSVPLTIVWLVIATSAVPLAGRLQGMTCPLVAIASLTFLAAAALQQQATAWTITAALGCALAGSALGYARYDLPPASLPAGRGAQFGLGFLLAGMSVVGALKNTAFLVLVLPLMVFGIPLLSSTYAIIRRGRLTIGAGRELLHDALLQGGLSPKACVILFSIATTYLSLIGLLLVALIEVTFVLKLIVLLGLVPGGAILFYAAARIASRPVISEETAPSHIELLDVPVDRINMAGALRRVEQFVESHAPHMVVTSDSSAIVRAQSDEELHQIIREADLVTPDGAGVVWVAKILGLPLSERVSGCDLMERICALSAQKGYRIYLLGSEPGVAEQAASNLAAKYPGLSVAGTHHGYFSPEEEPEIVRGINAARPDILFVAFGIPKQEKWIHHHLPALGVSVAIGVGGSLDVFAGRAKRAPKWMQAYGLEWLHRTLKQPKRIGRALLLPRFVWLAVTERWRRKRRSGES